MRFWKRLLFFLATGATTLIVAACYGVPADFRIQEVWRIHIRNHENAPIPGLQVTIARYPEGNEPAETVFSGKTTKDGSVSTVLETGSVPSVDRYEALIQDIDGLENGGLFPETSILKDAASEESTLQLTPMQ
jgi:hypothetical protein